MAQDRLADESRAIEAEVLGSYSQAKIIIRGRTFMRPSIVSDEAHEAAQVACTGQMLVTTISCLRESIGRWQCEGTGSRNAVHRLVRRCSNRYY